MTLRTWKFDWSKALFTAVLIGALSGAQGQSLKVNNPTHLAPGINRGTVDSFVGEHYWDVWIDPGRFELTFSGSDPQEGFRVGGVPKMAAAFVPKTPGTKLSQKVQPGGVIVYSGSVTQRTRLGVVVEPAPSPLVRQTTAYTLIVTGSADFGQGGTGSAQGGDEPNVVGVYAVKAGDYGVAKFTADGQVVTSNGAHGQWALFDAASRTYTVSMGRDRFTLIFQPGRGFIDAGNQNIVLEMRR